MPTQRTVICVATLGLWLALGCSGGGFGSDNPMDAPVAREDAVTPYTFSCLETVCDQQRQSCKNAREQRCDDNRRRDLRAPASLRATVRPPSGRRLLARCRREQPGTALAPGAHRTAEALRARAHVRSRHCLLGSPSASGLFGTLRRPVVRLEERRIRRESPGHEVASLGGGEPAGRGAGRDLG